MAAALRGRVLEAGEGVPVSESRRPLLIGEAERGLGGVFGIIATSWPEELWLAIDSEELADVEEDMGVRFGGKILALVARNLSMVDLWLQLLFITLRKNVFVV